ncbi:hypothetical protein BDV97DRAFT_160611 [Delphinella strobiligena]|nr:hypothetical protein BDV97DRAFT_160611 [Delphinella strobiligena]
MSKPESLYLQERLSVQRGHSKRSRRSDFGPRSNAFNDDLFMAEAQIQSKPHDSPKLEYTRVTPIQEGHGAVRDYDIHKNLGARQLDKHVDKLSKLNFDLKMELFHCRERMAKMQEQHDDLMSRAECADDAAKKAEQDRKILLEINEEMVKELEKRDEAVKEAVAIICDLEEKVDDLKQSICVQGAPSQHTPSSSTSPRGHWKSATMGHSRQMLPPMSINGALTSEARVTSQRRVPSFMCDKKPSTNALRSVYLEPASKLRAVKSYASVLSGRDDIADMDALDSPRLSVLSESSFQSIYKPKKASDVEEQQLRRDFVDSQNHESLDYDRYRRDNSRISEWVASRIPSGQQPHLQSRRITSSSRSHHQSLDDPDEYTILQEPFDENITTCQRTATKRNGSVRRQEAPTFGKGFLPPTPESASTGLLRESRSKSIDTLPTSAWHMHANTRSIESDTEHGLLNDNVETDSSTVRDIGNDCGVYPNGGSILTGTPSRFQIRRTNPPANNLLIDGDGIEHLERPRGKRRNTGTAGLTPRPSIPRSETSPSLVNTNPTMDNVHQGPADAANVSRNLQQQLNSTQDKRMLPDRPGVQTTPSKHNSTPLKHNSKSTMRASLSHKTQKLFRRMSDARDSPATLRTPPATMNSDSPMFSPTRPKTAAPTSTASSSPQKGLTFSPNYTDPGRRPSSQDSNLALVAANKALSSRGLPQSSLAGRDVLSSGTSRGLFKRLPGNASR